MTDDICFICGALREEFAVFNAGGCPINDEDAEPGDEWEEDNCLALAVMMEEAEARHDPNAPRPAWVDVLEAAVERVFPERGSRE